MRYWLCSRVQLVEVLEALDAQRSVWPSLQLPQAAYSSHTRLFAELQLVSNVRGRPNTFDFRPTGLPTPYGDLRNAKEHQVSQTKYYLLVAQGAGAALPFDLLDLAEHQADIAPADGTLAGDLCVVVVRSEPSISHRFLPMHIASL